MEHVFKISIEEGKYGGYFDTYFVATRGNNYVRAVKAAIARAKKDGATRPTVTSGERLGLLTR